VSEEDAGWSDELQVPKSRQELLHTIQVKYARFGDRIVNYLSAKAFQRGGLRPIFARVVRSLPIDDEQMHEALVRFLANNGVDAFFARVGMQEPPGGAKEAEPPALPGSGAEPPSDPGFRPRILVNPKEEDRTWRAPWAAIASKPPLAAAPPAKAPGAPPRSPRRAIEPKPVDRAWDGVERRSGAERRSDLERRSGKERRGKVDLVYKNKRYGGDRRSKIELRSGRDRRKG
jgi:hypothetical protein